MAAQNCWRCENSTAPSHTSATYASAHRHVMRAPPGSVLASEAAADAEKATTDAVGDELSESTDRYCVLNMAAIKRVASRSATH